MAVWGLLGSSFEHYRRVARAGVRRFCLFDEQKDVLVLLFLEEISSNQLSPFYRMKKLVKSRTYLSWTQARSHKALFWEKVRRALECGNEPGDNQNPLTANA